MRFLVRLVAVLLIASAVGLGATWSALTRGVTFNAFTIGPWVAWPKSGTAEIDPYGRALIVRSGELPVASGDGVTFQAKSDNDGNTLDGRCEVTISGVTAQARFWTLTLYDPQGRLVGNNLNRFGFTSQEIIRRPDGSFEITIAPRARAGNWLPTSGVERYSIVLRLYDTPVGIATKTGRETVMPAIARGECT